MYKPHDLRVWLLSLAGIQTFQDRNQSSIISDIITLTQEAIVFGYKQTVSVTFIFLNYDVETRHLLACCED